MSAVDSWLQRAEEYVAGDEIVSYTSPHEHDSESDAKVLNLLWRNVLNLTGDVGATTPRIRRKGRPCGSDAQNVWRGVFRRQQPVSLYRRDFTRILDTPKPAHEQLALLLGMRQGFRSGEVRRARYEHINAEEGLCYVFDSSLKVLYPLPLDRDVWTLYNEVGRDEGYVLGNRKTWKQRKGKPVGKKYMWTLAKRWAKDAGVFNWQSWNMTLFRAFFAKEWMRERAAEGRDANMPMLSALMRHRDPSFTWQYVNKFWYVEDVRRELARFQPGVQPLAKMWDMEVE